MTHLWMTVPAYTSSCICLPTCLANLGPGCDTLPSSMSHSVCCSDLCTKTWAQSKLSARRSKLFWQVFLKVCSCLLPPDPVSATPGQLSPIYMRMPLAAPEGPANPTAREITDAALPACRIAASSSQNEGLWRWWKVYSSFMHLLCMVSGCSCAHTIHSVFHDDQFLIVHQRAMFGAADEHSHYVRL